MSLFQKGEAYLGIDIGAGGIKLVELHKTKGRPQLWTYGILEENLDIHIGEAKKTVNKLGVGTVGDVLLPKDKEKQEETTIQLDDPRIDKYAGYLKELLKRTKVTTRRATASLPVSYIFHSVLTFPVVEEKKLDAIVKAEIKKVLSRPIEDMQIVHQEIPQVGDVKKKYTKLLVTAAPKDLVTFYTAIFQKAGLQLEELETEAFAIERSLVGHDKSTVMVVDIGSERTNFFIVDQGLPVTHRSIQIGGNNIDQELEHIFGLSREDIGQIKRDVSRINLQGLDMKAFSMITGPIVKEIEYSFDLYLRQVGNEGKKPEKIILTGGSAPFPPIAYSIQESFELKVFVGDPWARVVYQQGLKPVLDDIGPRMSVSIGLAMRNIL